MNQDTILLFDKAPGTLPLYEQLEERVLAAYPDVEIVAKKTSVSFFNTHGFLWASPPYRKRKGWPDAYMLVTFGLAHRLVHPRIAEAVEPYPNRWTHHVLVQRADEIDGELMGWIDQSYRFALSKKRGKPLM